MNVTALVEFLEPSEARKAFMKLAYTKFKHLPLYLEWAPDNSFKTPASSSKPVDSLPHKTESTAPNPVRENKLENKQPLDRKESSSEDEEEAEPDTTLFVKNLNFTTTEEMLKEVW